MYQMLSQCRVFPLLWAIIQEYIELGKLTKEKWAEVDGVNLPLPPPRSRVSSPYGL